MTATGNTYNKTVAAAVFSVIAILICFLAYDALVNRQQFSNSDIAMGTIVTQKLIGADADSTAKQIKTRIDEIENGSLSWRIKGSDIYNINAHAGVTVKTGAETLRWLYKTLNICKSSAGALDITVGKLTALWDIGGENPHLPKQTEIDAILGSVNYKNVEVSDGKVKIAKGQSLDMGALGKGIACDEALIILKASKVKSAIISVGGSILLFGKKNEINVGIRNPRGEANDYMGILRVKDCCVSTSGDYEKVFTVDGKKYHHILNPKTGYPAENGLTSVTIVCQSGLVSDALSTACFVLGYEKSLPLLKKHNAEAVFITGNNSVFVTDGLSGKFQLSDSAAYKLETGNSK